jgi:hypothetical protein
MAEGRVDPEGYLRSLTAEALLWAHPRGPLFPVSLGVMAVANAFVMLGLLPEPLAEAILAEHRSALERQGFGDSWGVTKGELTVRPGAHGYWQSRTAGPGGLREVPVVVAAAGVRCPNPVVEVCFEWVKLTSTGLRVSFRATAADPDGISPPADAAMRRAMSEISVTDDTGHSCELAVEDVGWSRVRERQEQEWYGQVLVDPDPARSPGWLEFTAARGGASGRVALAPPAPVPMGTTEPPWPSPAECYLAELATVTSYSISTSGSEATAGPEDVAEIVAKVADSLMAVGALPVTSTLLRESPAGRAPAWQPALVSRWGRRAHTAAHFRAAEHRGLTARLPLEHATAMIESVSAEGELVGVRLYGHPWMMGEYWPMIAPCFRVRATDDAGNEYTGMPGGWRGFPGNEGTGSFFFWPPVPTARTNMRVTVSTLWEAAWAEIELPRRRHAN